MGVRHQLRWFIVALACAGNAINYLDRANLATALPFMTKALHLGTIESGYVLSAFFFTYAPLLLVTGYLADRFGARIVGALAVGLWSVFSGLTSLVTGGFSLIALRLCLGVGESGAYPAWVKAVSEWFPQRERAIGSIIYDNGARIGSTVAIPLVALLIATLGWRGSFVVTAIFGLVWLPLWIWLYRKPRRHRLVSQQELRHIEGGGARSEQEEPPARWIDLLRHRTTWGMMVGAFGNGCVSYFFITWFPSYLVNARHFTLLSLGIFGAIPGLCALAGGYLGGLFCDWLVRRGVSVTIARKSCIVGGSVGAVVVAFAAFTNSSVVALVLLSVAYGCTIFANGPMWALPTDVAPTPRNVSSIAMLMDFGGMSGALVFPIAVGYMVAATNGSFTLALVSAAGLAIVCAIGFGLIVGRAEPLPATPGSHASADERPSVT